MADKFSRRSFLKGTGKTILTAGALSSGIGLSTSTTPTKVIPKVLKAPPRLLSPKARAYRSFLKGMRGVAGEGKMKSVLSHQRVSMGIKAVTGQSLARHAFEHSISKGDQVGSSRIKGTSSIASDIVANKIAPNINDSGVEKAHRIKRLSKTIHKTGRTVLAKKLQEYKTLRQKLVERGLVDKRKNTKIKGAKVGGGGKMSLPGLESAKNPTGMSLVTQRYTL